MFSDLLKYISRSCHLLHALFPLVVYMHGMEIVVIELKLTKLI
jgi:hypothetical protein